jgi:hypothetical protein
VVWWPDEKSLESGTRFEWIKCGFGERYGRRLRRFFIGQRDLGQYYVTVSSLWGYGITPYLWSSQSAGVYVLVVEYG